MSHATTHGGQYLNQTCRACDGKGTIRKTWHFTGGEVNTWEICTLCAGNGYLWQITINPSEPNNKPVIPYDPGVNWFPPPSPLPSPEVLQLQGQVKELQERMAQLEERLSGLVKMFSAHVKEELSRVCSVSSASQPEGKNPP